MPIRETAALVVARQMLEPIYAPAGLAPSEMMINLAANIIINAVDRDEIAQLCDRIERDKATELVPQWRT